jgi:predicted MPP superfamily phosphohydrolase
MKKFFKILGILCSVIIVLAVYILINNNTVAVTEYDISFKNLPSSFDGYKIMLVADYHNASYYTQVTSKIKVSNPDIIALAGDMISIDDKNFDNTELLIKGIKDLAPIYAVTGNHEEWAESNSEFFSFLREQGIRILQNEGVEIKRENQSIILYGLRDPIIKDAELDGSIQIESIRKFTDKWVSPDFFSILIMHRANIYPYISDLTYDLVLSGHNHGGLIELPFIGGFISPEMKLFPKYTKGVYTENSSKMIVSRGLDKNIKKLRIFNAPELVIINLTKL